MSLTETDVGAEAQADVHPNFNVRMCCEEYAQKAAHADGGGNTVII